MVQSEYKDFMPWWIWPVLMLGAISCSSELLYGEALILMKK